MATTGCATQDAHILGRSNSGLIAYKFRSTTFWCYDGSTITIDPDFDVYGYVYLPGWSYSGLRWSSESGG